MFSLGSGAYTKPKYRENFHINLWFLSENTRKCVADRYGDYTPIFFYELPSLIRGGTIPVDVALIMVTPPDENGKVSTGVSGDYTVQAVKSAKTVIAQINDQLPFTYGDAVFDVTAIDAFVEHNQLLPVLPDTEIGEIERRIGKNCADIIMDGDCLQLGIGSIPDAVCYQLVHKKHLVVHSEMLSDGIVKLFKSGAIDNSRKQIDIGIDLYGQVASDTIGYEQFSGIGGQVDFVRGAAMSKGGRSIIAMPSVTIKKDGRRISKVMPHLPKGQVVSTSRHDVDYVATEYGIVRLKGKTVKERARALISIAHPAFRQELNAAFEKMFLEKRCI